MPKSKVEPCGGSGAALLAWVEGVDASPKEINRFREGRSVDWAVATVGENVECCATSLIR